MGKTAFVFPGQGSQYIGMGKDFYEQFQECREMYNLAGKASGLDVAGLCFEENDRLNVTEYTQIAMLTMEAAVWKAVVGRGVRPDMAAGLSLGEYGALIACDVLSPEEAFTVIRKRGIYMQEAVPTGGAMSAVLGLDAQIIEQVCRETPGTVTIANYNCPGQIVITGGEKAVEAASERLIVVGAKRCVRLNVSGPFHSPMLAEAGERLAETLRTVNVQSARIPYLANVTADYVTDAGQVKPLLIRQVSSPVRWQQSVERMIADGVDTFIEIGPGRTLSGFLRKINREARSINIEKVEDLTKLDTLQ